MASETQTAAEQVAAQIRAMIDSETYRQAAERTGLDAALLHRAASAGKSAGTRTTDMRLSTLDKLAAGFGCVLTITFEKAPLQH